MLVKKHECRACGAPKISRPTTGYVYCDFCGVLTDWDLDVAKTAPGAVIPHEYERLAKELQPKLDAAKKANDKGAYHALQSELYEAYATMCPAAFSPRVKDPEYRKRFVAYTAATCVVQDFDPDFPAIAEKVSTTMAQLAWTTEDGTMRVKPDRFWPMWYAFCARLEKSLDLSESSGLLARQPDGAPRSLLRTMGLSAMAQAWLAYLDKENADRVLEQSGLAGDYHTVKNVATHTRTCGGCGAGLEVGDGAKRVVCESCGHIVAVGAESPCSGCGKPISWPTGVTMVSCPACKLEQRAMANPYGEV